MLPRPRALVLALVGLSLLAAANPISPDGGSDCGTGGFQCCDATDTAGSVAGGALLSLLGVVVQDVTVLLGVNCSPITVIGVGTGSGCSTNTVYCADNSYGSLVSVGCIPVTF